MNYKILPTKGFEKELKRLSRKYPSLKREMGEISKQLHRNPQMGTPLGNNCYKIRIAIASKGVGKSGGGRLITHLIVFRQILYLLSIYDKGEQSTLSDKEIKDRLTSEGLL